MRRRNWLAMAAVLAVSLGAMTVAGARPQAGTKPTAARLSTIQSCFQSGSGATFYRPCVTTGGNVSIEAPSGVQHIGGLEGYGLCSNTGYVYDAKIPGSGFGAPTISQPNGPNTFPLSIARSGGGWRVTQTFARDATQREFNITFAVKNTTASAKTSVEFIRFFDGDIDGDFADDTYDRSLDAVWGRDVHGVALQAVSLATTHFAEIQAFTSLSNGLAAGVCSTTPVAGPVVGDYSGAVRYTFSSIAAGATKTVKFTYRVI
jgi:hypothetical protein